MKEVTSVIERHPGTVAVALSLSLHLFFLLALHVQSKTHSLSLRPKAVKVNLVGRKYPHSPASPEKTGKPGKGRTLKTKSTLPHVASKPKKTDGTKAVTSHPIRGKKKKHSQLSPLPGEDVLDILEEFGGGGGEETEGIFESSGAGAEIIGGTGAGGSIASAVWEAYAERVWKLVRSKWTPPPGGGDMAVVVAEIDPDGKLISVRVEESSGNPSFDARAVEAVKKSAPFPPPPVRENVELAFRFFRR